MDNTFRKMIGASVERLAADYKRKFSFLRQVPSTATKLFIKFWDQARPGAWDKYIQSDFYSGFWHGAAPENFSNFLDTLGSRSWEVLPIMMKMTLGRTFVKKGNIPDYLRQGAAGEDELRKYGSYEWLHEDEIREALAKRFEIQLLDCEDSSCYQISVRKGRNQCETRVAISEKLKCVSYFHVLNGSSPFLLIDHSGDTLFPRNWDLISRENLQDAVLLLERIVDQFEASVD